LLYRHDIYFVNKSVQRPIVC